MTFGILVDMHYVCVSICSQYFICQVLEASGVISPLGFGVQILNQRRLASVSVGLASVTVGLASASVGLASVSVGLVSISVGLASVLSPQEH